MCAMKRISLTLLFLLTFVLSASAAQSVTLAWNANTETNLAGYRLYWGTGTRSYSTNLLQVLAPATTATVTNLQVGYRYFFAVTAYTSDGLESDYSDEVSYRVPGTAPGSPARPSTLKLTATNQVAAIWIKDPPVSTTVQWSGDLQTWKGWAQVKTLDSSAPVGEGIFLTGVAPETARFWRAMADPEPATFAPGSLPGGLRLTPVYPPLPTAIP